MIFTGFFLRKPHKKSGVCIVHNSEAAKKTALREKTGTPQTVRAQAPLPSPWGSSTRRMNQLSSQCTVTVPPYFSAAAFTVRTP